MGPAHTQAVWRRAWVAADIMAASSFVSLFAKSQETALNVDGMSHLIKVPIPESAVNKTR